MWHVRVRENQHRRNKRHEETLIASCSHQHNVQEVEEMLRTDNGRRVFQRNDVIVAWNCRHSIGGSQYKAERMQGLHSEYMNAPLAFAFIPAHIGASYGATTFYDVVFVHHHSHERDADDNKNHKGKVVDCIDPCPNIQ